MQGLADRAKTEDDIPFALRNRPELNQFQIDYWRMFQDLTGSRSFTPGGPASVPYIYQISWLNENGIDCQDERNDFLQMFTKLDTLYLDHYYEKNKVK